MIRKLLIPLVIIMALAILPSSSSAQVSEQKCLGDPQMCAQILELQKDLQVQKDLAAKAHSDKGDAIKNHEQQTSDKAAKAIAFAATLAVILKIIISLLTSWKGYFKSDKAKAWLKFSLVLCGFGVFLSTNLGFGIPWWQSLILAGGGPGSILVHELVKLWPVFRGEKKYIEVDPDGDPTNEDPPEPVQSSGKTSV